MKFASYRLLPVVLVLLLAPFLYGQQSIADSAATMQGTLHGNGVVPCPHLFTSGTASSNAFIQYCVNDRGNITSIQTPFGHFHMGAQGEGYGICQQDPPVASYYDYLSIDSGNWQAPQVLSSSASAIQISRSTSDGNWTLVQTFTKVAPTGSIKIAMALTNNQDADKVAYLVRFADIDPDGASGAHSVGGASLQSTFAWSFQDPNRPFHYGVELRNIGKWSEYQQGFIQRIATPPNPCAFAFNASDNNANLAVALVYAYVGTVPAHKAETVTMSYRGR